MSIAANAGLAEVLKLLQSGDSVRASARGKTLLALQPNNPTLLHVVGIACCQAGDPAQGAGLLERALRFAPTDIGVRQNLARALLDTGDIKKAEAVCAAAPASAPQLLRVRADIAKARGDKAKAIALYKQIVTASPHDPEALNNLGTTLLDADDTDGALAVLERALALRPASPVILLNLGKALAVAARYAESLARLEDAVKHAPEDPKVLLELGRALNRTGRSADALPFLADAARLDSSAETLTAISLAFTDMGEFDRAKQGFELAITTDPSYAPAYLNLGITLERSNLLDDVEALISHATSAGVKGDEIAYLRAMLSRRRGQLTEAIDLLAPLSGETVSTVLREQLKGQLYDSVGDAAHAFAAYQAMNDAVARGAIGSMFDGTEHRLYVEQLTVQITPERFASWKPVDVVAVPPSPVFLVGFPRSGTTLLDTVLMGHPDTHVLEEEPIMARVRDHAAELGDLATFTTEDVAALRRTYFEELARISPPPPGAMIIDKLPLNLLRTPLIHRVFPDARFIFAARHPCDVVLSCFMQAFKVNQAMASFLDIRNAALFYDRALGYWEKCRGILPISTHVVMYERLVTDLEGEVAPLIDYLGLSRHEGMLDFAQTAANRGMIRTPSYSQVVEGIYQRSRGRWERYRTHMADVLPILAPWVERLGYAPLDSRDAD